jgi:hypothetical protein
MVVIVKTISDDEITVEGIKFLFSIKRKYVRIGELWYNKKLHKQYTFKEFSLLSDNELIYGKEKV